MAPGRLVEAVSWDLLRLLHHILHEVILLARKLLMVVSFDTFDSQDATTFALTLRSKHRFVVYMAMD
jgi:hypothetical protein